MTYALIIVNISHENVDRPFTYAIPSELKEILEIGDRVRIPFGAGNKEVSGYVIGFTDKLDFAPEKLKAIKCLEKGMVGLNDRMIRLAAFLHNEYGCTMITALKTVLPVKKEVKEKKETIIRRNVSIDEAKMMVSELLRRHKNAQARLLSELTICEELPGSLVTGKLMVSPQSIKGLAGQKLITVEENVTYRNPVVIEKTATQIPTLSEEQQTIVDAFVKDTQSGEKVNYLIHGITGAGKTEVYMRLISETIAQGKQAIMLIPEIALTYQTLIRFYARFGDRVTVMNSKLSQGEKYDQTLRAQNGEVDVVIGPRSALFMPFQNLGLIIVDEEQESGYKSETSPKYHVREVAAYLQKETGCGVVFGSATPSLEVYYRAKQGEIKLFHMTKRLTGGTLPTVYVEDLREELKNGNKSIFSKRLKQLMTERLYKGDQTMLFLNRRGYAGFVSCRSCGEVIKCPHCDISLSEHKGGSLVCHYCGYTQPKIIKCPSCGAMKVAAFRAGTEQIEEMVHKEFPSARTLRMDADTTSQKNGYEQILEKFGNHEADILIGTQMIVKGHDFKDVTLVGVLAADMSLFAPDYRSAERTFDLITQAAGRAGRGDRPGEVVIQTYKPDHYAIVHASNQDYEGFYADEIFYREMMGYPPTGHMLLVMASSKELGDTKKAISQMFSLAKENAKGEKVLFIGPCEPSVAKIQDMYRMLFYVKCKDKTLLRKIRDGLIEAEAGLFLRNLNMQYDIDPQSGF